MNGELAQMQSGGLDLKSSILRSRNTCLYLNFVWRYWSGINIRKYRHRLILKIWWNFRFDGFVMKDIAKVNAIKTFVGKRQFQKGKFVYFIFLNTNRFEKSVIGNIQDDCCKFVLNWIRICNSVNQTWVV